MDAVSYSLASKQAQRIEKFIENPDSTSGIVTVPKTIASGETVTVPAGRVAVLPNVVVDGDLVVEAGGEIFVPAGGAIDYTNGIKVNGESLVMSVPTAYHIYNGNVEATNTVITNGFSTTLYTGNGSTQAINTGVDMATQWGDDDSETFGGLVWLKSRSHGDGNALFDTVRGVLKSVFTNVASAESVHNDFELSAFNNNGFSVLDGIGTNRNLGNFVSWNFQTTHRRTGTTNHGKAYTEHYNPYTGFTIIKYKGSGLAGHEIPHSLGRKLGFVTVKNLSEVYHWISKSQTLQDNYVLSLNQTIAQTLSAIDDIILGENSSILSISNQTNGSTNQYIMYGWANSYFDEDNTLIGNYEIGVYQGTGAAGNKVTTRGKPAWIMIKRLDSTGNWQIHDNIRVATNTLFANLSNTEDTANYSVTFNNDGFTLNHTQISENASGGQYLYIVVYDNDAGSGKSKYPKATDTTNLAINALVPYANGIDVNGSKVSIEYKNETITGLTLTQGKNYPYSLKDGTYGSNRYQPMYGSLRDRVIAGENPDYFDLKTMKWYETTGGEELVTNGDGSSTTGWLSTAGFTIAVSNGTFLITRDITTPTGGIYQNIPTTIGKKYKIKYNIGSISGGGVSFLIDSGNTLSRYNTAIGKIEAIFTANNTSTKIEFLQFGVAQTGTINIDNISVFEVEPTIGAEIQPRTYLDCVVYADNNGQVSYVEELPKIEYKDVIKANEFKGKNACTAFVSFDGTTTPPTIRDSYNVSSVIRTALGTYDIYFENEMDNTNYVCVGTGSAGGNTGGNLKELDSNVRVKNKITLSNIGSAYTNPVYANVEIFGGKTR